MCTIIGATINTKTIRYKDFMQLANLMIEILPTRGRDGFGYYIQTDIYDSYTYKSYQYNRIKSSFLCDIKDAINNSEEYLGILMQARAVPETEEYTSLDKIQPLIGDEYVLVHNGLIYNDKELAEKYDIPENEIPYDSHIILELLEREINPVKELNGSFSVLYFDKEEPKQLYYMVNYQPLYVVRDTNYVLATNVKLFNAFEIEPYTYGSISIDKIIYNDF